jgi:hypothetical protein
LPSLISRRRRRRWFDYFRLGLVSSWLHLGGQGKRLFRLGDWLDGSRFNRLFNWLLGQLFSRRFRLGKRMPTVHTKLTALIVFFSTNRIDAFHGALLSLLKKLTYPLQRKR